MAMELGKKRLRLGDLLLRSGALSQEQLNKGLALQKDSGKKLGEVLVEHGILTEDALEHALSSQLGYEIVDLQSVSIPPEVLKLVPVDVLKKNKAIPFAYGANSPNVLRVAMADPMDMYAIDDLAIVTNLKIEPVIASMDVIMRTIDKYYGAQVLSNAAERYAHERRGFMEDIAPQEENVDVTASPIVQLVSGMVEQAVRQRASDIHIEPMETQVRVRYRIDGALYERATYSIKLLAAISARIKIIGGMDISEKRKPQDGRITQVVDKREYDIRVSVLPTIYGEKIVMRLASKNNLTKHKSELGLNTEEQLKFDRILSNPHGILLVTGPTGSGKSTTLYTALSELNREDVNIITVEDPVEANIDGINQVQVNTKSDLTFANALRSILRQDPDIIMIGEIRDTETAEIAVQASITGHLVVSTLHTNSAVSTITRLEDMGVEPYLLADSMVGIIAQRLVRRLCPTCKHAYPASEEEKEILGVPKMQPVQLYKKSGCPQCNMTGYKGRIGVYEILEVSADIKSYIEKGRGVEAIKAKALEEGMNTLRMSATRYVLDGITTIDEMKKVSFDI